MFVILMGAHYHSIGCTKAWLSLRNSPILLNRPKSRGVGTGQLYSGSKMADKLFMPDPDRIL